MSPVQHQPGTEGPVPEAEQAAGGESSTDFVFRKVLQSRGQEAAECVGAGDQREGGEGGEGQEEQVEDYQEYILYSSRSTPGENQTCREKTQSTNQSGPLPTSLRLLSFSGVQF